MKRSDEAGERPRTRTAGNRSLLVAGLGAALAAVLSLGLLSAATGSTTASQQAAGAAQAPAAAAADMKAAAAPDHQVDITGYKFGDGKQLVVEVGQTVRWTRCPPTAPGGAAICACFPGPRRTEGRPY